MGAKHTVDKHDSIVVDHTMLDATYYTHYLQPSGNDNYNGDDGDGHAT